MRTVGCQEEVLSFHDDLSCGPIAWGTSRERAAWWSHVHEPRLPEASSRRLSHRLETTDERLVVWFGRHSASELTFVLAMADRLGERLYEIVDVTDLQWTFTRPDGTSAVAPPAGAVSIVPTDRLMAPKRNRTPHLSAGGS